MLKETTNELTIHQAYNTLCNEISRLDESFIQQMKKDGYFSEECVNIENRALTSAAEFLLEYPEIHHTELYTLFYRDNLGTRARFANVEIESTSNSLKSILIEMILRLTSMAKSKIQQSDESQEEKRIQEASKDAVGEVIPQSPK